MANRLEKQTVLRERQQLQAKLDQLFAAQEQQTAGKKKRNPDEFAGSGDSTIGGFNPFLTPSSVNSNTSGNIVTDVLGPSAQGIKYGQPGQGIQNPFSAPQLGSSGFSGMNNSGSRRGLFPNQGRGLFNTLATGASFLGAGYDIWRGSQDSDELTASDYYNPQYGSALAGYNKGLSLLADRRYDPTAELQDVERQGGIFRQGLRNTGYIGAGSLRNQLAGSQVRQQRGRGDIFTKKQNVDLSMMGQEAQGQFQAAEGRGRLGAQRVATDFTVAHYNAQARAGQRNILGAGLANLGMGAQTQQLMANQRLRDEQSAPYLGSYGGGLYNPGLYGPQFGGKEMTPQEWQYFIRGRNRRFGPQYG